MITQEQELNQFILVWQSKPIEQKPQITEEVASYIQESNHTPDYYFFDFDIDDDLCSPYTGKKTRDCLRRKSYTDNIELEVVNLLDSEIKKGHNRFAWISPPCDGVYPDLKIIVSEVIEFQGKKRFLNRSFLFNFDFDRSWAFAQEMTKLSVNKPQLNSLEDIRSLPLILDPNQDWVAHLSKAAGDPDIEQFVKSGEDQISKQQALINASDFYEKIIKQPSVELKSGESFNPSSYGFGDYISSCPPSEGYTSESWPSWCVYDSESGQHMCKFCRKGFTLKSDVKKHRCVC